MSRKLRYGLLAAASLLAGSTTVAAGAAPSPSTTEGGATIEVVTHGQASDPFWSVFKRGVDDAAAQMGATVNYSAPAANDMTEMASLIDAAVAKAPDGLVVSVPDFGALEASLLAANEAGIPIITVNSGSDHYQEIGAITHIGQDE
ncbi:MAG TPA: substrate-binding domain-containing protein, partial [Solirubrobacteraceae bacterium]|nr:substrate-binding domain-containing protein [Solirubrobacteraceae bacterium]